MKKSVQNQSNSDGKKAIRSPVANIHFGDLDMRCRGVVEIKQGGKEDRMSVWYILNAIYGKSPKEITFQDGEIVRCIEDISLNEDMKNK